MLSFFSCASESLEFEKPGSPDALALLSPVWSAEGVRENGVTLQHHGVRAKEGHLFRAQNDYRTISSLPKTIRRHENHRFRDAEPQIILNIHKRNGDRVSWKALKLIGGERLEEGGQGIIGWHIREVGWHS